MYVYWAEKVSLVLMRVGGVIDICFCMLHGSLITWLTLSGPGYLRYLKDQGRGLDSTPPWSFDSPENC